MMARRFDALLIDFYGTISAGDREAVERACRRVVDAFELPLTADQFAVLWGERFFEVVAGSSHRAFRTLHQCELASLRQTLAGFVGEIDPEPFVADLEAYWVDPPLHPDAVEFLNNVDLPVCCVSNADTRPLTAAIQKNRLVFDAVITSEQVRCYKPDAAIFRHAVEALGIDPERTMHVGDSLHSDVGGAARLGITTAWLCRNDRIHDIGNSRPDYTLSTLAVLSELLA